MNLMVISASQSCSSIVPMRKGVALLRSIVVTPPLFDILLVLCASDSPSDLANSRSLEACQGPRVSVSVQPGRLISTQICEHSLSRVRARFQIFARIKTSTIMTIFKPGNCAFLLLICASTGEVSFLFTDVVQVIMFFILLGLANSIFMDFCTAFECVVYSLHCVFCFGPTT